jgi:hypothetical protein
MRDIIPDTAQSRHEVFGGGICDQFQDQRRGQIAEALVALAPGATLALFEVREVDELLCALNDAGEQQYDVQSMVGTCECDSTAIFTPVEARVSDIRLIRTGGTRSFGPAVVNVDGVNVIAGKLCWPNGWPIITKTEHIRQCQAIGNQMPEGPTVAIMDLNRHAGYMASELERSGFEHQNPGEGTFPNREGMDLDSVLSTLGPRDNSQLYLSRLVSGIIPSGLLRQWDGVYTRRLKDVTVTPTPHFPSDHIPHKVSFSL